MTQDTPGALRPGDTKHMDILKQFTNEQLRAALATAWSTAAAEEIRAELAARGIG